MPSGLHVTSCSFLRLGCNQHELFSALYARSNKKRSAKLLRCFPHCCPDHIERSYCGCSVHVLFTFESAEEAAKANVNDDLIVCARFEAATTVALPGVGDIVTAMPVDSIMALPGRAIRTGVNVIESDWVRGEKANEIYQQQFPENTILYELNNHCNPHWYYGYESGSTKAQRELKHVLAAYMFQLHPLFDRGVEASTSSPIARLATVVVRHASPSFTMISYRRLNDVRRSKKKLVAEQQGSTVVLSNPECVNTLENAAQVELPVELVSKLSFPPTVNADQHQSECDTNQDPSTNFMDLQIYPVSNEDTTMSAVDVESSMSVSPVGLHSPLPIICCPICCTPVNLQTHPLRCSLRNNTIDVLQSLLVVQFFMSSTPLDLFSFHFGQLNLRIQQQWLSTLSPFSQVHQPEIMETPTALQMVADIASMFSLANFVPDSSQTNITVDDPVREQMVLQTCANLLLDVLLAKHVQQIVAAVDNNSDDGQSEEMSSSSESCEHFCQWVAGFLDELTQLLVARSTNRNVHFSDIGRSEDSYTFPALVDDILSLIYGEAKYHSLRKPTSMLLLRRDGSLKTAVQKLFRVFVEQQQHRLYSLHIVGQSLAGSSTTSSDMRLQYSVVKASDGRGDSSGGWNRRWFLESPSVSVIPLSDCTHHSSGDMALSSMPSLLSVATLLRLFASVDVSLYGLELTLKATIAKMGHQLSGAELLLDGAVHSLDTLPSGLSALAGAILLGECWSVYQYEGSRSDDGSSIDLLLVALPASPNQTLDKPLQRVVSMEARRVRFRMNLNEVRGRHEDRFSVVAEVSSAHEKLQYSGERDCQSTVRDFDNISSWGWSPTMEVHATYIGAAIPYP